MEGGAGTPHARVPSISVLFCALQKRGPGEGHATHPNSAKLRILNTSETLRIIVGNAGYASPHGSTAVWEEVSGERGEGIVGRVQK